MPIAMNRAILGGLLVAASFALLPACSSSKPVAEEEASVPDRSAQPSQKTPPGVARTGISEINDTKVKTVQFTLNGLELTDPIVEMGARNSLLLQFDILEDDVRDLRYTLIHCNKDWRPSQLSPIDYLDGFTEGDVTEYDLSFNSQTAYTHYRLTLPNQYVRWTKSGNYLLEINDDYAEEPLMRLRFVVVEPRISIQVNPTRPADVSKDRTHQEFDVAVGLRDVPLENPRRNLTLTVMQNGDWRTAMYNVPPRFIRDELLLWDYQDKLVFPAAREWRTLDLRTLSSSGGRVASIDQSGGDFDVQLFPEEPRTGYAPETRIDLNGRYVIESFDNSRVRTIIEMDTTVASRQFAQTLRQQDRTNQSLRAEYADVLFSLKAPAGLIDGDVHLYGALTNYALDETTLGVYNPLVNAYVFKQSLKQGFYDYAFVTEDAEGFRPDWTDTEGNTFQTENSYQFLLYYRPYGERYDRVIGYEAIQVNR